MCFSIDLWDLLEHPKIAYFGQILPFGAPKAIFAYFEEISTRNIFVSTFRMKTTKVWKVLKIFQTFRKFSKKGLGAPTMHPNPQIKILKKWLGAPTKHPNLQMKFWLEFSSKIAFGTPKGEKGI